MQEKKSELWDKSHLPLFFILWQKKTNWDVNSEFGETKSEVWDINLELWIFIYFFILKWKRASIVFAYTMKVNGVQNNTQN